MDWCYCVSGGVFRSSARVLSARCFRGGGLWNGVFCYTMSVSGINGMRDKIHMNGTGLSFFCLFPESSWVDIYRSSWLEQ